LNSHRHLSLFLYT